MIPDVGSFQNPNLKSIYTNANGFFVANAKTLVTNVFTNESLKIEIGPESKLQLTDTWTTTYI